MTYPRIQNIEQSGPSSISLMTRTPKRMRRSMDLEDIDKLIDQNQSIVGTFPDEEVLVDEPVVEILEASHKTVLGCTA